MDKNLKFEIIEEAQEAIVRAGGRFFRQSELLKMTLDEFLELTTPNNIRVHCIYNHPNH